MTRRIPLMPTVIVLIAVAIMIRLGFWQIDRLHQKEALLARYAAAEADTALHPWPGGGSPPAAYSRVAAVCLRVTALSGQAGQNAARQPGWTQVADCEFAGGARAQVVLGWSAQPPQAGWSGGAVTGTYLDRGKDGRAIVADPPLAGLQANARPDPRDLPNNHLAYAVQWFLFAAVALVIYVLALRKRG